MSMGLGRCEAIWQGHWQFHNLPPTVELRPIPEETGFCVTAMGRARRKTERKAGIIDMLSYKATLGV